MILYCINDTNVVKLVKGFFDMDNVLKVYFEFVTTLLLFYVLVLWP